MGLRNALTPPTIVVISSTGIGKAGTAAPGLVSAESVVIPPGLTIRLFSDQVTAQPQGAAGA